MTKDDLFDLIKDAGYCVLATTDGDQPRARPMMPYLSENGQLLLACISTCRTISQIQVNPKVEMCYIDRKMGFARVSGLAKVSPDPDKKELVWEQIPMLRQYFSGPADPNYVLLEIAVTGVEVMTPQQREPEIVLL